MSLVVCSNAELKFELKKFFIHPLSTFHLAKLSYKLIMLSHLMWYLILWFDSKFFCRSSKNFEQKNFVSILPCKSNSAVTLNRMLCSFRMYSLGEWMGISRSWVGDRNCCLWLNFLVFWASIFLMYLTLELWREMQEVQCNLCIAAPWHRRSHYRNWF